MASNTVVKSERFSDIDENDPLAELSRIMGLDKRNETDASDDVDFGIDLEKELLGEAESAASAPAETVDDLDIDFDTAFADFDEVVTPVVAVEPEPVAVAPTPVADDFSDDFANVDLLADEMDKSFVAAETPAPIFAAPEPVSAPEPVYAPEPMAAAPEPELAYEPYEEPVAAAAHVEAVADDFDAVQSLEAELGALLGNHTAPVAQEAPVVAAPEPVEAVTTDWQSDDFELAAAEDESVVEAEELPVAAPVAYEAEPVVAFEEPVAAAPVEAVTADDFDLELDDFDALAPMDEPVEAIAAEEIVTPVEPIAAEPETPVVANEQPVIDELEAAIADFENDAAWDGPADDEVTTPVTAVPEPVRAPQPSRFASLITPRSQPVPAASASDDEDPFAALAALAAAPPIMKTLGRANPVAASPVAERSQPAPIEGLRPAEVAPQRSQPVWPFLNRTTATPGERPAPAERPTPVVAAPRPVAPVQPVAPPAAPTAANANPYRDPRPASAAQPAAYDMPAVAPTFARDAEPAPRPAAPAWLNSGHAPAARAETPRIERAPAYTPAPRPAPVVAPVAVAAPVVAAAAAPAIEDLDFDLDNLMDDIDLAPELETIDFNDDAVSLADDFDIPELAQEETVPGHADLDDFETDFADAFNQLNAKPAAAATPSWRQASVAAPVAEAPSHDAYRHPADTMLDEDFSAYQRQMETDAGAYDDQADFSVPVYDDEEPAPRPASRLPLFGAIFAGLAILIGGGAYAWSTFGEAGSGDPAFVRADASPIKVKPETPGGVVVPNQDGKVYEQVAGGAKPAAPSQEKLISTFEEPIVPEPRPAANALPGVESPQIKSEERVTAADTSDTGTSAEETAAISTKRVRTMIVKPDGTLVEREVPADAAPAAVAAAPAANQPAAPAAAAPPQTSPEQTSTIAAIAPVIVPTAEEPTAAAEEPVAAAPAVEAPVVEAPKAAVPAKPVKTTTIKPKPVAEAKPVPQPEPTVELAGGPAAAAAPIAGDFWTVQIASQPSREGAQASYEALANRYGGVLGGKGVNIVQADVKGKPMWRVRIPAASKGDANILCAKLKTAGGSCFVSK